MSRLDGVVVTAQPEYDDVVRVAAALDRPVVEVLAEASAGVPQPAGRGRPMRERVRRLVESEPVPVGDHRA